MTTIRCLNYTGYHGGSVHIYPNDVAYVEGFSRGSYIYMKGIEKPAMVDESARQVSREVQENKTQ